MCYYDQYQWDCRDWRWGNFRAHCQKEYRTGETCGMKLVFQTINTAGFCSSCEKIEKKLRRIEKAKSDYRRWSAEPHRYKASMEKAAEDIQELQDDVRKLQAEKDARYANIGNSRRN